MEMSIRMHALLAGVCHGRMEWIDLHFGFWRAELVLHSWHPGFGV